jgi:hypothetical protein
MKWREIPPNYSSIGLLPRSADPTFRSGAGTRLAGDVHSCGWPQLCFQRIEYGRELVCRHQTLRERS